MRAMNAARSSTATWQARRPVPKHSQVPRVSQGRIGAPNPRQLGYRTRADPGADRRVGGSAVRGDCLLLPVRRSAQPHFGRYPDPDAPPANRPD